MTDGTELERSAARLAVDAVSLMNRVRESSGLTQRELASRLGVGESRVSQILHGDGNVRVATLARVLRASGYRVRLDVQPADLDTPVIPRPTPRRRRKVSVSRTFDVGRDVPDLVPASWSVAKVEVARAR